MNLKEIDVKGYENIVDKYRVNSLIAKIVKANAYNDLQEVAFFNCDNTIDFKEEIFAPIKKVLLEAKQKQQKVFVFGDYDCDGISATTIMVSMLNKLEIENGFYIPNRLSEGYGLNLERLQQAYEKGYRILITVDNGISAYQPLKWAKEHGMTIIVTDHHLREKDIDYDYLLHPSLLDEKYKYLSGGAVAYMLSSYMGVCDERAKILAGLSIISDAMSLLGINVGMVRETLALLNQHKYPNLEMLDRMNYPINENDLSFQIIPKINAIGRLSDRANANNVVKFLLCENKQHIEQYANWLIDINSQRQCLSNQQYEMIYHDIDKSAKIIFIINDELHDGLIGLLASKIASNLNKIVFIGSGDKTSVKISGRSVSNIDVMKLLDGFKENFIDIGGHTKACGLSISKDKIDDFKRYLLEVSQNLEYQQEIECIRINDLDLTVDNIAELFKYRPFGQDRKIPLVRYHLTNYDSYNYMKNEYQLKWTKNNIDFISFDNKGYKYYLNKDVDVIANIKENKFNEKITYQLLIVDFIE